MVNTPAFQAGNAGSISGTPLHNRITSFWFHTVKSRHTGAAVDWPHRVANGSTPRSYPVVSGFFGVFVSIQFKQFDKLSAAENVLLVFPNELRKAYALFVIKRKPLVVNTKQEIQSFSDEFIYSRMKELLSPPLCRDIPESEQVDCLFCLERYDCANSIPPEFFQLNDEFQRRRYINRRRAAK